jgi:hypothetical protein
MKRNIFFALFLVMAFSRASQADKSAEIKLASPVDTSGISTRAQTMFGDRRCNTRYLFLITTDGLRWQEVFEGADSLLLQDAEFVGDTALYASRYWADNASERREILLPFFWGTLAKKGQLYGNRNFGNNINTANRLWFSYPGYNEMLTGRPDDLHIFSNAKWTNPNESVFEFLNKQPEYQGKTVAFATWDVFSAIFREKKAGFPVRCGDENECRKNKDAAAQIFGDQKTPPDFHTWASAMDYIKTERPHLTFIGLDDTDARAHEGQYDLYLDAAHRFDAWLSEFWNFIQSDTMYRNKTTLLLSTDHGRGTGKRWKDHSWMVSGSDAIWMAVLGPDTPASGEMKESMQGYQKQTAQTIAQLLGHTFEPKHAVAPAITSMFQAPEKTPAAAAPIMALRAKPKIPIKTAAIVKK